MPSEVARSAAEVRAAQPDRGSVTAELALLLPLVVIVLGIVLLAGSASAAQLRHQDGARAGAREAALGSSDADVVAVARAVAGPSVQVRVVREPPWVRVQVEGSVASGFLGGIRVAAVAHARVEP